jgi:hypothetical protein
MSRGFLLVRAELFNVRFWHLAAFEAKASNGRYWSNNGQMWVLPRDGLFAYDPTATLALHCGNGFNAPFSPYQNTRLSR